MNNWAIISCYNGGFCFTFVEMNGPTMLAGRIIFSPKLIWK